MTKLQTLVMWAAAIVSAAPVDQDHGRTLPASIPFSNSHSFFKSTSRKETPASSKDYCGHVPQEPVIAEHQTATATFSHSASHETLAPIVHWSVDTKPATNVIPTPPEQGSKLYYGVDGS